MTELQELEQKLEQAIAKKNAEWIPGRVTRAWQMAVVEVEDLANEILEIEARKENKVNKQAWVCSKCGRTVLDNANDTRGWLIDSHKDGEMQFNGEMVIRCPNCITAYALRTAEHGKEAIR